jgi:hypothetical protein
MKKLLEGMGYILKSLKKKKTKKMTKDQLGKAILAGSVVSSIPGSFLAQKVGQVQREAQKPVRSVGSGLSAKEKKAWVKANTPKPKRFFVK